MLWLGNKDELMRRDVWIKLPRRRFRPGESVTLTAGARDTSGDVLTDAVLAAELTTPSGQQHPLRLGAEGDDWTGTWESLSDPGEYRIAVTASVDGQAVGQTSTRFVVQDLDLELSDPAANPEPGRVGEACRFPGRTLLDRWFPDETRVGYGLRRGIGDGGLFGHDSG